jgi:hypothetical protein
MKPFLAFLLVAVIAVSPAAMAGKKNNSGGGGNKGNARAASGSGGNAAHQSGGMHQNNVGGNLSHQNRMGHQGNNALHQGNNSNLSKHNQLSNRGWHHQNQIKSLSAKTGQHQLNFHHQALHTHLNVNNHLNGAFNRSFHVQRYSLVVRNYHVVYHERFWWRTHYTRIVLVGGGWYYWDAGYWFPAWGYDPGVAVYAYEGPIYSYDNLPPDQVILNIQSELEFEGYYSGPIDGQLGPLTRAAIADYQRDHDLEITSAVDEPTVDSLGLA